MTEASGTPAVRLKLPPQLGGNNLHLLLGHMGLEAEQGNAPDEWLIRDNIVRERQPTRWLVRSEYLAGPKLKNERFELLDTYPQDEYAPSLDPQSVNAELKRAVAAGASVSLAPMMYAHQVRIISASDAELVETVRALYRELSEKTFVDDSSRKAFPDVSAHWVSINPVLYWRVWLPAIAMRLEHDPSFSGELQKNSIKTGSGLIFAANHALAGSAFLYGNYLGPLLACMSPRAWAIHGTRMMNSIVLNLGRTVRGHADIPMDALDLVSRRMDVQQPNSANPELSNRTSWREAIDWWTDRLNKLLTFLSDPASYGDQAGNYQPYRHQNWLINTAELFDRVTSALRETRNRYASVILTFSALDLVSERFLGSDTGAICSVAAAQDALDQVRDNMSDRVAEVLIPGAERAVEALRDVATGFYLNTGKVEYTTKDGPVQKTPLEAVGPLIRARRNAVHGFGGSPAVSRGAHELLAQHNGELPADLAFLPYLYLLKVLCNLDNLQIRIEKGGKVNA